MKNETLNQFINRRMAELGLGYKDMYNAGIGAQTLVNIRNGKVGLQAVTKEKLARVLQCSQGDIQNAIANTDEVTPFGEVVVKEKQPSVMETDYPELKCYEDKTKEQSEGSPAVPENTPGEPEPESNKTKPEQKKITVTDIPKQKKVKILKQAIAAAEEPAMTAEQYRRRLKDLCLQELAETDPFDTDTTALFAVVGMKLLKELMRE